MSTKSILLLLVPLAAMIALSALGARTNVLGGAIPGGQVCHDECGHESACHDAGCACGQRGQNSPRTVAWGTCFDCDGVGSRSCGFCGGDGIYQGRQCTFCNGRGRIKCFKCNGSGVSAGRDES
jgi:hypothetical protein